MLKVEIRFTARYSPDNAILTPSGKPFLRRMNALPGQMRPPTGASPQN
jgi:hypothetical protein